MTQIHFTDDMQKEIYDQVFNKDRKWLLEAVAYVNRVRRGYPEDDPRWDEQTTIDHVLYYVRVAKGMQNDATLDDRNTLVQVRRWLDNNPCILNEPKPIVDILKMNEENGEYEHKRATPEELDKIEASTHDIEAEITEAMGDRLVSDVDAAIIAEQLEPIAPPDPSPEPAPTPPEVTKAVKKKATKKKASKKKATKKKVSKKKTTKKKVSKKK